MFYALCLNYITFFYKYVVLDKKDTIENISNKMKNLNLEKGVTYISTGGGATLEFITNHDLPGLINIGEK